MELGIFPPNGSGFSLRLSQFLFQLLFFFRLHLQKMSPAQIVLRFLKLASCPQEDTVKVVGLGEKRIVTANLGQSGQSLFLLAGNIEF